MKNIFSSLCTEIYTSQKYFGTRLFGTTLIKGSCVTGKVKRPHTSMVMQWHREDDWSHSTFTIQLHKPKTDTEVGRWSEDVATECSKCSAPLFRVVVDPSVIFIATWDKKKSSNIMFGQQSFNYWNMIGTNIIRVGYFPTMNPTHINNLGSTLSAEFNLQPSSISSRVQSPSITTTHTTLIDDVRLFRFNSCCCCSQIWRILCG